MLCTLFLALYGVAALCLVSLIADLGRVEFELGVSHQAMVAMAPIVILVAWRAWCADDSYNSHHALSLSALS